MTFEKSLKEKQRALNAIHSATGWYAFLVQDNPTVVTMSSVNSGSEIITATGHDFVNGNRITFSNVGGSLPGGLATNTEYRVITVSGSTFQVCIESTYNPATKTGTPIDITSAGSGTTTITERPLAAKDDLDVWVRKEVASYFGSARQPITPPSATINYTLGQATLGPVNATFSPTSGSITFRYFCILNGGIATRGSSQGILAGFEDYLFTQTIDSAGKIFQYGVVI
jgi:hypothetical protein